MSVSPALGSQPSTEAQAEQGKTRAEQSQTFPPSGSASTGEISQSQNLPAEDVIPHDEVKVQIEPPGEIAVYQFVNQQGTLVLQVPPQPVLNLAVQISQELAQEAAPKAAAIEGGKDHGH
jgi:hypothetical protein